MHINNSPLRMLRTGQIPGIKPRLRTSTLPNTHNRTNQDRKSNPESLESCKSGEFQFI